ncbi:tRNA ligase 1-like [Tripterygium wilfordii]|uniref:tRNA ligase 1-like n=1 Tax=Tripterygium wilfordii TaxID=458696 RepID=UPI0018F7F636|nr:tRNA ligase 1-like [Tripterygium wilfordii]
MKERERKRRWRRHPDKIERYRVQKFVAENIYLKNPKFEAFLKDKLCCLRRAHATLAHKRSHGVTAVASHGFFLDRKVPVELTAFLFTDKMAALEAQLGSVDGEKKVSRNQWTAQGVAPTEANALPQLHCEGKATRIEINPPITIIQGMLEFF